tara:strand:+ start:1748 stop:4237 length:2490 start_codon:yes stop_codon:yes gene_type:complete
MANNYTVDTITATGQGSSSLDSGDFPSTGAGGGYPFLTITPDAGYVVSAENFTIGGSTPSSTTASPYTAMFTNGSGGCSLPAPHITSVRFSNSTTAGTIGNVVFCELTGVGGTFHATNTTNLVIDIDGSAECAPTSYSFWDGYHPDEFTESFLPNQNPKAWIEVYPGITTTNPLALSTNTNNTTVSALTTLGTNNVNQISGSCCSGTNNVTYTRHFYADPGQYFIGFPTYNVNSNTPGAYSVVFTGVTQATAPGVPNWNNSNFWTHIKAEVSYNCQGVPLDISAGESVLWRRSPMQAIPSAAPPPIVEKCLTYPVQQVHPENSFLAVEFQATPGVSFEIVAEHLDTGDTYDWTTSSYTAAPTSYSINSVPNTGTVYVTLQTPNTVQSASGYNFVELKANVPTGVNCNGCVCKWIAVMPSTAQFRIQGTNGNNYASFGHTTLGTTFKQGTTDIYALSWSNIDTDATPSARVLPRENRPTKTISGNITSSETLTTQAGTTGSTLIVTDTSGVSLYAPVSGTGVTPGRIVSNIVSATEITLSGTHAIGAGVAVTFSNLMGLTRQPTHNDFLNNRNYEVEVLANLSSPAFTNATYLIKMPDQDIIDIGAQAANATYQNMVFSQNMPGGVFWNKTNFTAMGNNVAQVELLCVGQMKPDNIPVGEIITMTTNGGGELLFDNFSNIAVPSSAGVNSIAFQCDVTVIQSHYHTYSSAAHANVIYALSPANFIAPYRTPRIATYTEPTKYNRTVTLKPFDRFTESSNNLDTVILGGVTSATINLVSVTHGSASVVGREIHYIMPNPKGGPAMVAIIVYTITDAYGQTGPNNQINLSIT